MRSALMFLFAKSPFENLKRHADKVKECAQAFKRAVDCYLARECGEFSDLIAQVAKLEHEADDIKGETRNSMPRGILLPVDKFQLFQYLREQDKVLDNVEDVLFWLSFRYDSIPLELRPDFKSLIDLVIPPIEGLAEMADMALSYFKSRSEHQRDMIKNLIRDIRAKENQADTLERELKAKIFSSVTDPLKVYHLIRLTELISGIADHAENAADMMRVMVAK